jgi:hypothetical protein
MRQNLTRLGVAGFVLLLSLIVSLPANGHAQATGSIEVGDQKVINGAIVVERATISQDGWIVVHKAGPDGKILVSPEIGKVQIPAGTSQQITIPLTEAVADGATLWPMLHVDNGAVGVYEFPGGPDTPVVAAGMAVMGEITITGSETRAAAGTAPPEGLPVTSGEGLPLGLLAAALALIAVGGAVVARSQEPVAAQAAVTA